jgi:hypothetical protein
MDETPEEKAVEQQPVGRNCAVCNLPIPERPYQAKSVRTCSPSCAKLLAVREHPDIDSSSGSHASWRKKLLNIT